MPNIGDLIVGGVKPVFSAALENSHQLATGSGQLYDITALNFNASARLVILLDQTASPAAYSTQVPTAGAVIWAYQIAGLSTTPGTLPVGWLIPPIQFQNGLWVVFSTVLTTPFSITASTADGFFSALVTNN